MRSVLRTARSAAALAGVLSATLSAQAGFLPFDGPAPPPVHEVREPGGRLLVRDGGLIRRRQGGSVELANTHPDGTGEVHGLARHPADRRVFVAADHGLFVLDADHDVLDAPSTRDGFPSGQPRGVHVDPRGRLWLLTDEALAVLDPRFFQGRVFGEVAGLPAPPYRALGVLGDGRLVLTTGAGERFVYRPDVGPPPSADLIGDSADRQVAGRANGSAVVETAARGRGGASLRFRRANHHLLYPLVEGRIHGLKPGKHAVHLVVEDQDLRSRSLGRVVVDVPYPDAFDTSFLPYVAAGAALLSVLAFLAQAWRRGVLRTRWRHAVLSGGLALWFGLMLLAGLLRYGKSWPFLGFSMYTETYYEGSVLYQPRLQTVHRNGARRPMSFAAVGLVQDGYWQVASEIVHAGPERLRAFASRLQARRNRPRNPVIGFEIIDHRIRLTAEGPVDVAPNVLLHWSEP